MPLHLRSSCHTGALITDPGFMVNTIQSRTASKTVDQSVSPQREHEAKPSFWLNAYQDPVAGLRVLASSIHTCDLSGDGDWRLVTAGLDKKLKASTKQQRTSGFCRDNIFRLPFCRCGRVYNWLLSNLCRTSRVLPSATTQTLRHLACQRWPLLLAQTSSSTEI